MTAPTKKFSKTDVRTLAKAITEADGWKGSLMPDDWPQHEAKIAAMRRALARADEMRRELSTLKGALEGSL